VHRPAARPDLSPPLEGLRLMERTVRLAPLEGAPRKGCRALQRRPRRPQSGGGAALRAMPWQRAPPLPWRLPGGPSRRAARGAAAPAVLATLSPSLRGPGFIGRFPRREPRVQGPGGPESRGRRSALSAPADPAPATFAACCMRLVSDLARRLA
jgi:hypothetical protein